MTKSGFSETHEISLPKPKTKGPVSVEEAIKNRKSIRRYTKSPLTIEEISQLLWSAGGVTCDGITGATRSFPSAGGCYPQKIYIAIGNVKKIEPGLYFYNWKDHSISLITKGDIRSSLATACWQQSMITNAPINIIFTGITEKTTKRYGERGERYICMDTGHAGQNVSLQAESLKLGSVIIGAFNDNKVKNVLNLKEGEEPLYIIPIGRKE